MIRHSNRLPIVAALTALVCMAPGTGSVQAADAGTKLTPAYERSDSKRPASGKPARRKSLPTELRVERVEEQAVAEAASSTVRSHGAERTRPGRGPDKPGAADERRPGLDRLAVEAGRWAARERIRTWGVREYYRIGFFEGQREALADPTIGRWDFQDGRRWAWRDPQVWVEGRSIGRNAAYDIAMQAAERQVIEQFTDLTRDPRFRPSPGSPAFEPPAFPSDVPTLESVFRAFPVSGFVPLRDRHRLYLAGWSYDGWMLSRSEGYTVFYESRWSDPRTAYDLWAGSPLRARIYLTQTTPDEKLRFQEIFRRAFRAELGRLFESRLMGSYERGFDDGWEYGAFIHAELDYRLGFHEGFLQAVADSARASFAREYPLAFVDAYAAGFAEWSENAKPEIGQVWIADGNDDGVMQPGEELLVEYELINYGGRDGRFNIAVNDRVLIDSPVESVFLPARSVITAERPLVARIDPRTPARTHTQVEFRLADLSTRVPLLVTHPLQIDRGSVRSYRSDLDGQVRVELRVENRSRRPLSGTIEVRTGALPEVRDRVRLEELGESRGTTVTLDVSGLDPLMLMAGNVELTLNARSGGELQDRVIHRLPDTARDLRNRDLLLYLVRLSEDPGATGAEIAAARALLLTRLREDWRAAAHGSGNPYKVDYRRNETRTALGDLVQAYRAQRHRVARPDVFSGMSGEITTLARDLPGMHPFLRKYMRRLASTLP